MFVDRGGLTYLSPDLGQDADRSDDGVEPSMRVASLPAVKVQ